MHLVKPPWLVWKQKGRLVVFYLIKHQLLYTLDLCREERIAIADYQLHDSDSIHKYIYVHNMVHKCSNIYIYICVCTASGAVYVPREFSKLPSAPFSLPLRISAQGVSKRLKLITVNTHTCVFSLWDYKRQKFCFGIWLYSPTILYICLYTVIIVYECFLH